MLGRKINETKTTVIIALCTKNIKYLITMQLVKCANLAKSSAVHLSDH